MTDGTGTPLGLQAITSLQENASHFFAQVVERHGQKMACKAGCAACCHVSLDVFPSEALLIVAWARTLESSGRAALREALARAKASGGAAGLDAAGRRRPPCVFLADGLCAVYAARPVICRTQGAPLQLKVDDGKGNVTLSVDACPLNFTGADEMPTPAEWLDLERLTVLQVLADRQCMAAGEEMPSWKTTAQGRVPLAEVRRILLAELQNATP
jgi:Fe-S-cluster containining protein